MNNAKPLYIIMKCKCSVGRYDHNALDWDGHKVSAAIRDGQWRCHRCGGKFNLSEVHGKRTGHQCDARCLSSTGSKCECSCGGKNHGASYA